MSEPVPEAGPSEGTDPARPPSLNADAGGPTGPAVPSAPTYKGAPLDAERGPGLGCFWIQVVLLATMLALTPISVWISAPEWVSAALLLTSLGLLFFVGQTSIFLMRLVAADRRAQRRPLREGARPTVGQLSRESEPASERESEPASERESEPEPDGASDEDEAPPTQR